MAVEKVLSERVCAREREIEGIERVLIIILS